MSQHVPRAVAAGQVKPGGVLSPAQRLNFSIVLPLRNRAELASLLNRLYDPSSPDYRHFLSVADFTQRFGPSEEDLNAVVEFARAKGFTVTESPVNRLAVPFSGTVEQVQRAFHVTMRLYRHPGENRDFFSPDREPSLDLGVPVAHIAGLNNFSLPRPMAMKAPEHQSLASVAVLGSGPGGSYLGSDMRSAYYGGAALSGSGQTVGLVQFGGYNISDVTAALDGTAKSNTNGSNYLLTYTPTTGGNTYTIPINNVLRDGATGAPSPGGDAEEALDIAQAIGMAPGLSQVRVYIGGNDADILNAIAEENIAKQVSISWGWSPDDPQTDDCFFEEMAAQGQSVFVASGDSGAFSPADPSYYPAEDEWVTAVGGTSLTTSGAGGAWISESAWFRSGGGISPDGMPIPDWQAGIANSSNAGSATLRNVPDVAMEADFDNYACNLGDCAGNWGGTSFAAPRWAGFMALMNQQATGAGNTTIGFVNPQIYAAAGGVGYPVDFHDIVSGNNGYDSGYKFYAVPGYDLVTGWGSPIGQNLIDALAPAAPVRFQLSALPNTVTLNPGASETIGIAVEGVGGFNGSVNLSVTGLPAGVTASVAPNPTVKASVLTLTADSFILGGSFQLVITGTSGSLTAVTTVPLTVNSPLNVVTVTSPAVPVVPVTAQVFKPGTPISVSGTLLGGYQNLRMESAPGVNPLSGWSSTGITLNGGITSPVTNETIGTWDTSSIVSAGYFTMRLSADYAGVTYTSTTLVYLEPDLLSPDWPKALAGWSMSVAGSVPALDAKGNVRLAVSTMQYPGSTQGPSQLTSFSADGSSQISLALPFGSWRQPASGNAGLDAGDEIASSDVHSVIVFAPDGTSYALAPQAPLDGLFFLFRNPILEDVDGDTMLEVVAMGTEGNNLEPGGTDSGVAYVFAWRNNGRLLNGNFPIQVPDRNLMLNENAVPRVLVGDVDGDGAKEFVVVEGTSSSTVTPRLFAADGSPRSWGAPIISSIPCELALADLDHNGKLETILFTCDGNLHVLQPDGTERPGWPRNLPYSFGTVSVGDMNRDGHEEIVVSSGDIDVFNPDGTELSAAWPMRGQYGPSYSYYGPAVLADVNGDGLPEIVTTLNTVSNGPPGFESYNSEQLVVLDRLGNIVRSWNLLGAQGEAPSVYIYPTVGDFSQDGLTEIAVLYGLEAAGGSAPDSVFTVLETGAPFNAAANDWPMLNQNPRNTSVLQRVPNAIVTMSSSTNPSMAGATVSLAVAVAAISSAAGMPTGVVNLLDGGQNIASCLLSSGSCTISAAFAPGTHSLVASYVGDNHFAIGISAILNEVVDGSKGNTTTVVSAVPGSVTMGGTTTLTASAGSNLSGALSGTVAFTVDNTALGTAAVSGGAATLRNVTVSPANGFTAGADTITATYSGDANFASSSGSITVIVTIPTAVPPTFSPAAGTYPTAQTVTISDTTPGVTIYYTTNGDAPTANSTLYSGAVTVNSTETLKAIAIAPGNSTSSVAAAAYIISNPADPVPGIGSISPAYTSAGSASFILTVNGTDFTEESTVYWGASALKTLYVSGMQLTAQVAAGSVAVAGTTAITVQTPGPGGGTSNSLQFEVDSAQPGTTTPPSFSLPAITVVAGLTASYPVTLPSGATNVTATCLNLPGGSACSYSSTSGAVAIITSSTTPKGTYQVTVVFTETEPGTAASVVLFPILLLPFAFVRRKLTKPNLWFAAAMGLALLVASASVGCGGGVSISTPVNPPAASNHNVTSSGVVGLTIQ